MGGEIVVRTLYAAQSADAALIKVRRSPTPTGYCLWGTRETIIRFKSFRRVLYKFARSFLRPGVYPSHQWRVSDFNR